MSDHDDGPARVSSKTDRARRPDGAKPASAKPPGAKPDAAKAGAKPPAGAPEKKPRDGTSERRPAPGAKPSSAKPAAEQPAAAKPSAKPSADAKPARADGTTRSTKRPEADATAGEGDRKAGGATSTRKAGGATSTRAKPDKPATAADKPAPANGAPGRDGAARRAPGKSDRVAREMEQVDLGEAPSLPRAATAKTAAKASGKAAPDKTKTSSRKRPASSLENDEDLEANPPTGDPDKGASLFANEVDREGAAEDPDEDGAADDEDAARAQDDDEDDDAMSDDTPKVKKAAGAKPKPGAPKGEGGPPAPKKPHPLFMFLLLGVPIIGLGLMVYFKYDMFKEWFDPSPPEKQVTIIEKSDTLVKWDELRNRTDALSMSIAPVMKKIFELEEKLARSEEVDFPAVLADLDRLGKEAADCDAVCNSLLAGIQADAKPPLATLDDAKDRARKMNTKEGLNIGNVIEAVAQRIQDIGTQRRKLLEMQKELAGAGSGKGSSVKDDSVVPATGSGSEKKDDSVVPGSGS